jgi:flagellar hook protein FlgE
VGEPNTGGRGQIFSSSLEQSNVDLSNEFTNMIVTQRGFQASSRTVTTADQMLTELINLKR